MTVIQLAQFLAKNICHDYMGIPNNRIVIDSENWDAPKDKDLYALIIHDPTGNETIGVNRHVNYTTGIETVGRAAHERFAIEIVSRSRDAAERYQEVLLALESIAVTQAAEIAGVSVFRSGSPLKLNELEGASILHRYRIPIIISNVQTKAVATTQIIDKMPQPNMTGNVATDSLVVEA